MRALPLGIAVAISLASLVGISNPAIAIAAPSSLSTGTATTAASVLQQLPVADDLSAIYSRSQFGDWTDADGDGCDTRQEVLIAESLVPVTFGSGCAVVAGQWRSWYDAETWSTPSDVDIDHFVPLGEVWRSGAANWTSEERTDYANDLEFDLTLVAVTDNVNSSKGDRDPAQWLPPLSSIHCQYAVDWVLVKYRWNLTIDPTEQAALGSLLSGVCGETPVTTPARAFVSALPASGAEVERIAGADRYEVAINIAQEWAPGVPVVYIAKGTDYPDALSAAPAATAGGGPLLLVSPDRIPGEVLAELERLQPQKIVVVGGTASVQPRVFQQLSALAPEIVRLDGADRYAASRRVVEYAFGETGVDRVYVSTGLNFPDALSASAAAGKRGGAVLLVPGRNASIDAETTELIESLAPADIVIAGGPNSVSAGIESTLRGLDVPGGVIRLAGGDRFEASRNINHDTFTSSTRVFLATGMNFPDALAGAPLAGRLGAPLYVIPGACVPQQILADIRSMAPAQITILGGPNSVAPAVETLTPCPITPTGTLAFTCSPSPTLTATVTNPNSFSITLTIRLSSGAATTAEVPALSTGTYVGPVIAEDTTQGVSVSYGGGTFLTASIHRDCAVTPPPGPPANPGDSKNCGDFATWAEAQGWFVLYYPYYGDIARLDGNNDGVACESLPGAP